MEKRASPAKKSPWEGTWKETWGEVCPEVSRGWIVMEGEEGRGKGGRGVGGTVVARVAVVWGMEEEGVMKEAEGWEERTAALPPTWSSWW